MLLFSITRVGNVGRLPRLEEHATIANAPINVKPQGAGGGGGGGGQTQGNLTF